MLFRTLLSYRNHARLLVMCTAVLTSCGRTASDDASRINAIGSITVALDVAGTPALRQVHYTIVGPNGLLQSGVLPVDPTGRAFDALLGGLPAGRGYTITLSTEGDGQPECSSSASFDVVAGQTTRVAVALVCNGLSDTGGIQIDGTIAGHGGAPSAGSGGSGAAGGAAGTDGAAQDGGSATNDAGSGVPGPVDGASDGGSEAEGESDAGVWSEPDTDAGAQRDHNDDDDGSGGDQGELCSRADGWDGPDHEADGCKACLWAAAHSHLWPCPRCDFLRCRHVCVAEHPHRRPDEPATRRAASRFNKHPDKWSR